jgi:hypothetical protein
MKALRANEVQKFTDIPNVGKAMESDFKRLGIKSPKELKKKSAFALYKKICSLTGRQDPCVLDTYMTVIDFMNGGKAKPWWYFTEERKKKHPNL